MTYTLARAAERPQLEESEGRPLHIYILKYRIKNLISQY
jgi:hypothetical protein